MTLVLLILRGLFVLLLAAVGWHYVNDTNSPLGTQSWLAMAIALCVAVLAVCADVLSPRKKLTLFAGTFLGLLVGVAMAYALSFVVQLLVAQFMNYDDFYANYVYNNQSTIDTTSQNLQRIIKDAYNARTVSAETFIDLVVGCVTTYLAVSFILQTKDDFRFIIPYVEFRKQLRGSRPLLLDTSVLIDGRILAIVETGIFESPFVVPRFVLVELQAVADSPDKLKRNRGRRGLDVMAKLQQSTKAEISTYDTPGQGDESHPVDQRLITLAKEMEARLVTTDFNLNKVAQLAGVDVVNINELAARMKPEVLPGERMRVKLIKHGESPGQGIGYLDDGTMVVVEQGRGHLDQEVEFVITNTVQTNAGKMIFGRLGDIGPKGDRGGDRGKSHPPAPSNQPTSQATT